MSEKRPRKTSKAKSETGGGEVLPLVPLRGVAPLPGLVVPVYISRAPTLKAVEEALKGEKRVLVCLQTGASDELPSQRNLRRVAGIAQILQSVKLPSGDLQVDFHVVERAKIKRLSLSGSYPKATVEAIKKSDVIELRDEDEENLIAVKEKMEILSQYESDIAEHIETIAELFNPGELADLTCSVLGLDAEEAQRVVEEFDASKRLELSLEFVTKEIDARAIRQRISKKVETAIEREQHQELLREQLRLIRAELGEVFDYEQELSDLTAQLKKMKMPAGVRKDTEKQLRRLQQLHPDTSEAALARTYIDWIMDLPWSKRTKDRIDLKIAKQILDEDHFGLKKPKERILDFLGVRKLKDGGRGPVLLLVGPPGVGKTSLGRSIARALGREFIRISLGGLRDEAELRGHRRTYVGALPGRIIQGLKRAGTKNPVFMLDELDKIGKDFRGDPASVLLEVLDPEQNFHFEDHYINVPFDLSEVMFICTANIVDPIPSPLLDRMEVIEINGYTAEEKLQIAKRYLLPQEMKETGIEGLDVRLSDQTLLHIMNGYTRESGVRALRRGLGSVLRKVARIVAEGGKPPKTVSPKMVQKLLGPVDYIPERRQVQGEVGVVTGLAWTSVGGEPLTVEVAITKGKGQLSLTGQLGEVMRESAMTALTFVLSRAEHLGFDPGFYERSNVHVHVPHGGIPKDGPSAGIAIATAIVSALTSRPVIHSVAMTGEITLRGSVLEIGGLQEKALAALRYGLTSVIIPKENERELVEFPPYLRAQINFIAVENVEQVFESALMPVQSEPLLEKKPTVKRPIVRGPKKVVP